MGQQKEISQLTCHRCKKLLSSDEAQRVPLLFKLLAGLSLGPVHAGMWLWEDLSAFYCAACRRWVSFLSVVLAVIVLSLAILGYKWARKHQFI